MIHYHGTPITPDTAAVEILSGRHAMVSFARPDQIELVGQVCQSFVLDNGAFTFWKTGRQVDVDAFYAWIDEWRRHPGFDWALIPDVIDGSEAVNDTLLNAWPFGAIGVPVWHLHESLERLARLAIDWPRLAIGSSGQYAKVGTERWFQRMHDAMVTICDEHGRPETRLHGLRMLDPRIFTLFPFSSADSTNIARNIGIDKKWARGNYLPPTKAARGIVMAHRIEHCSSPSTWKAA